MHQLLFTIADNATENIQSVQQRLFLNIRIYYTYKYTIWYSSTVHSPFFKLQVKVSFHRMVWSRVTFSGLGIVSPHMCSTHSPLSAPDSSSRLHFKLGILIPHPVSDLWNHLSRCYVAITGQDAKSRHISPLLCPISARRFRIRSTANVSRCTLLKTCC